MQKKRKRFIVDRLNSICLFNIPPEVPVLISGALFLLNQCLETCVDRYRDQLADSLHLRSRDSVIGSETRYHTGLLYSTVATKSYLFVYYLLSIYLLILHLYTVYVRRVCLYNIKNIKNIYTSLDLISRLYSNRFDPIVINVVPFNSSRTTS